MGWGPLSQLYKFYGGSYLKNWDGVGGQFENLLSFLKMPPPPLTGNKRPAPLFSIFLEMGLRQSFYFRGQKLVCRDLTSSVKKKYYPPQNREVVHRTCDLFDDK